MFADEISGPKQLTLFACRLYVHMARHGTVHTPATFCCARCACAAERKHRRLRRRRLEGLTSVSLPIVMTWLTSVEVRNRPSITAPTQPPVRAPPMPFLALETFRSGSPVRADAIQSRRRGEGRSGEDDSSHGRQEIIQAA